MSANRKISFPNLDGLRFFAFLSVFLFHSFYTDDDNIKHNSYFGFLRHLADFGDHGVSLFFVLSGFLITYLLLNEKDLLGRVNVPAFYMRRILRIWPLYFVIVFVGFVVYPWLKSRFGVHAEADPSEPIYFFFFLSNFNNILHDINTPTLRLLWSVSIEEQFYLVWPMLVAFTPRRFMGWLFIGIILSSATFRYLHLDQDRVLHLHTLSVISDMAVGGGFAWLCYTCPAFVATIGHLPKIAVMAIYCLGFSFIYFRTPLLAIPFYQGLDRLVLSLFFAFIILEQNFALHSFFKLSNWRFPTYWGTYTYGLYCWHCLALLAAYQISHRLGFNNTVFGAVVIDNVLGLVISLLVSWISYQLYEKHFLKLKHRFAYVTRGETSGLLPPSASDAELN